MDQLMPGQELGVGGKLESQNGKHALVLQGDGNLVLYQGSKPIWDTGTWNLAPADRPVRAVMQQDGNFVLYSGQGRPAWDSRTYGSQANRVVLQNDRNVVVYTPDNRAVWSTDTWVRPGVTATTIPDPTRKDLGAGHFMWTHADLYGDREVACWTRTQSVTWFGGYIGTVVVVAAGPGGRYLGETPQQRFGVNGTAFGGSDRTDNWNAPLAVNETPERLVAIHGWAFEARVLSTLWANAGTIAAIVGWL